VFLSRFFKSQLSYLSIPSFSLPWLTGVLFLTFDIDRSTSTILNQHPRTSRIEDWLLPFKQSIYLIFTLIGRYQQFIINNRECQVLNNDYLLCSLEIHFPEFSSWIMRFSLLTSQGSHLESLEIHFPEFSSWIMRFSLLTSQGSHLESVGTEWGATQKKEIRTPK
jgi:hypothetical protein